MVQKFPQDIQDFAKLFVQMQLKRYDADYNPAAKFFKSEVSDDIDLAELAIDSFNAAPALDRRAFCAYVLFREPRGA
jgi:hypothetical protein